MAHDLCSAAAAISAERKGCRTAKYVAGFAYVPSSSTACSFVEHVTDSESAIGRFALAFIQKLEQKHTKSAQRLWRVSFTNVDTLKVSCRYSYSVQAKWKDPKGRAQAFLQVAQRGVVQIQEWRMHPLGTWHYSHVDAATTVADHLVDPSTT